MDFDKLDTIDDWENLGIDYTPASHKDWTIQDLLTARDKLKDLIAVIPDSQKYSIFNKDAASSDYVRLLLLRSAFENALSNHKRNTAYWSKDPYLNEYTSKAEDYDGNTYKGHQDEESIGTIPKDDNRPMWVGKDGQVHIGEPGEEYTKQYGELDPHIRKALDDFASSNEHFGEGQAEGLDSLLEGLKDTPHDNRW